MYTFYEFFAGGGMARAGLGPGWTCGFANDFDEKKGAAYRVNWGGESLRIADVRTLEAAELPGQADLAWASFPCQDLSLAGAGKGLCGERSSSFWPFFDLMRSLRREGRAPKIIALENVCGALSSHGGKDFASIGAAFVEADYRFGALVIDAALFTPQSRPRLFIVAVRRDLQAPAHIRGTETSPLWRSEALGRAFDGLPANAKAAWVWWNPPAPPVRTLGLNEVIEPDPVGAAWRTEEQVRALLAMMSEVNRAKVRAAQSTGKRQIGTVYKRTRLDENGRKAQRAEVRFDNLAGCLRTPAGGSSRQSIIIVEGDQIRSRLLTARETARLMGLPEHYQLPEKYNDAYHLTGDGVVVPVVRHLAATLFEPILDAQPIARGAAI